jgi:hypothetical protein
MARLDEALYSNASRFFAVFLVFVVWAFWPSYFARLFEQPNVRFHAHGIVLTLWCVMLVVQAQLVRTNRRQLHKQLGKASYVLAPALIVITLSFVHYRVSGGLRVIPVLPASVLYFLSLTLNALVAFAVLYGLAIYHRKTPPVHGRFMLATAFPLFSPVTDRLIAAHFRPLIGLVPQIDGSPVLPVAGFALADLILLGLSVWDLRSQRRVWVFPTALGVLLLYHTSVLTLYRFEFWQSFCRWFLSLPLS